jgi:hypothetical protein
VRRAADRLVRDRFLLEDDADRLIAEASASRLLPTRTESDALHRSTGDTLCR